MSKQQTIRTKNPAAVAPKALNGTGPSDVSETPRPTGYGLAILEALRQSDHPMTRSA